MNRVTMGIAPLGTDPLALLGLGPAGLDAGAAAAGASALETASAASPAVADALVSLSLGSELLGAASGPTGIGTYLPTLQQQATTAASAAATTQLETDASLLAPSAPALTAGPFWSSGAQLGAATAAVGVAAAGAVPADAVALGSLTATGQEVAALFGGGALPTSGALYDVLA